LGGFAHIQRGRFALVLVCIAAAAFLGRAAYVLTVTRDQDRTYDELFYKSEATSFANGDGFEPTYFAALFLGAGEHPPLTPAGVVILRRRRVAVSPLLARSSS
jgi:hypothetical protein